MSRIEDSLWELTTAVKGLQSQRDLAVSSSHMASVSRTTAPMENSGAITSQFQPCYTKMDFPRYSGTDTTEWLNRVSQFFKYQSTPVDQRVTLASFHLEGEANQWLQWLQWTYDGEGSTLTWEIF